jgi:two-component system, cell cycle sensor histidine kinase and response regulator CckA
MPLKKQGREAEKTGDPIGMKETRSTLRAGIPTLEKIQQIRISGSPRPRYARQFLCCLSLIVLILAGYLPTAALAQPPGERTVRIAVFNFYPAIYQDKKGEIRGFFVDLVEEIAKKEHWRIKYVYGTWGEGLERIQRGEVDLLTSVAWLKERANYLDYGKTPIMTVWSELFVQQKSSINGIREVSGKRVAVVKGEANGKQFLNLVEKLGIPCTTVEVADFEQVLREVDSGRVDAGVVNNTFGIGRGRDFHVRSSGVIFNPFDIYFAVAKGRNRELLTVVDRYLAEWRADDRSLYHSSLNRWLHRDEQRASVTPAWLLNALLGLALSGCIGTTFIVLLRRQVASRTRELQISENLLQGRNEELAAIEEELRHQLDETFAVQKALVKSEEFLSAIVENMPAMVFVKDALELRFMSINKAGEALLGYCREELIGKSDLDLFPEAEADFSMGMDRFALKRGTVQEIPEEKIHDRRGLERTLHTRKVPLFDAAGQPRYLLSISEDITEKKSVEEQLRQAQKMDVVGQLAGGIAHDFNNMLTGIIGAAEMLNWRLGDDPYNAKLTGVILEAATRSADLTRQLLAFSRKGKITSTAISINDCINAVVAILERTIDKRITLEVQLRAENPIVIGDPGLLQNALLNLAINARDAMAEGGTLSFATANLELGPSGALPHQALLSPGAYLEIAVSDTGIGMAPEVLEHIYEPFFTTKEAGKGTGLGLAAVYGTVKEHNGTIDVCSEPGQGTVFRVCLPSGLTLAAPVAPREETVQGRGGIMLVDDEAILRLSGHCLLEELGYQVYLAEDGEQALELYARERDHIGLVILDMVMPKLSGKETFLRLKELDPRVRVLFSSGFHREGTVHELLEIGAKGFIHKPYRLQLLSTSVAEALADS